VLILEGLYFPLTLNDNFAGNSNLILQLFVFMACNTLFHAFLAFSVSVDRFDTILVSLPL
jgi:hypothetical protein